ncbi:MAG TPA: hypothetical protein VMX17_03755 [Candidatus Glassbacteria bacterium]|nr:hypothetical protein [Candidatus Glassbacteria bacterium]
MLEEYLMSINPNFIDDYVAWVKNGCKEIEEEESSCDKGCKTRIFKQSCDEITETMEYTFPPDASPKEISDFVLNGKVPDDVEVIKMPGSGKRF